MRKRHTRNIVAAVMAGALMAAASPAIAHAQSSQQSDPTPLPMSILKASASAGIQNYKSKKVLQPSGSSTANGAKIVQQPWGASSAQYWTPVPDGDYYSFENSGSGKNLGIDGASTSAGAVAIQANGSGDLNQDWYLATGPYPPGTFSMKNRKSGLCLGISGASTANGAQAAQFPCDGSANQGWTLVGA
ncbi:RICIN domain-containing protein [Streptomyces olindensis]|uniref:RICIN domain-containing protein n=1 Tax=Streptomyces olindensis TaxID=358823 RepID=UPI00365E2D2B